MVNVLSLPEGVQTKGGLHPQAGIAGGLPLGVFVKGLGNMTSQNDTPTASKRPLGTTRHSMVPILLLPSLSTGGRGLVSLTGSRCRATQGQLHPGQCQGPWHQIT